MCTSTISNSLLNRFNCVYWEEGYSVIGKKNNQNAAQLSELQADSGSIALLLNIDDKTTAQMDQYQ